MTADHERTRVAELQHRVAELEALIAADRATAGDRFRGIADALPVMISYVDSAQRFRFVNRAYEDWFERPVDAIINRTLAEVLSPTAYAERLPFVRRALAGERLTYEMKLAHSSGERLSIVHHIPHVDQGQVRGFYALIQDITEQAHTLELITESEARFRRTADSAPIPMWVTAPDRSREFVNIAYAEFLGLSYDEARHFDWRTILHADDQDRVVAESIAGEASGRRFTLEARYRRGDGEWRWLRSISQPRFDAEGMPEGFIGVAIDITDAKRAADLAHSHAEALEERVDRRTRERDRLWELSQDAILVCDRQGVWRSASPAWTRVLGWPVEDLVGDTARALIHPDDLLPTRDAWARLIAGNPLQAFTNRMRSADDSYRWFDWSAVAEGDEVYCIARDITVERVRSAALHEAEEALRQAQKMDALGQLTGGVAHDFNNLLTPILGTLDLLMRRQEGNDRDARLIDGALQSATRAKTLVQRLLAFARRQPLHLEPVRIEARVRDLEPLLRTTLGPRVGLRIDVADALPPALADPNQVEMAVLNLAVNARDAMPGGGQLTIAVDAVDVGAEEGLSAGTFVRLAIRDNGLGMDEETRRRATEPFFSTKDQSAGTGLGLSMVHGLAGQLGGALRIDSAPGRGTTVELLLPSTAAIPAEPEEVATGNGGDTLKILLVDDEPLVRANTAAMLADMRHDVIECASGAEALQSLRDGLMLDILVTDQIMPDMTGTELIAEVRAVRPDLPSLLVSGYRGNDADGTITHFLPKPFTIADLAGALDKLRPGAPL